MDTVKQELTEGQVFDWLKKRSKEMGFDHLSVTVSEDCGTTVNARSGKVWSVFSRTITEAKKEIEHSTEHNGKVAELNNVGA